MRKVLKHINMKTLRFVILMTLLFGFKDIYAQTSAITISKPENIGVCNDSEGKLKVRIDFPQGTSAAATVKVTLAAGVNYVGVNKLTSSPASVNIAHSGGTANAPIFTISPTNLSAGNFIEFEVVKQADCGAITGNATALTDKVEVTVASVTDVAVSEVYGAYFPGLTITNPAAQSDAMIGQSYTRNFTVTNGTDSDLGYSDELILEVEYQAGVEHTSLQLGSTVLTPASINGKIYRFELRGALLGTDGRLTKNEILTFTETYKVLSCNDLVTTYRTQWGCGTAADFTSCRIQTGTGTVNMASGTPNYPDHFVFQRTTYTNMCSPIEANLIWKNTGSGNKAAAGMYNFKAEVMTSNNGYPAGLAQFTSLKIGSQSIPVVYSTPVASTHPLGNFHKLVVDLEDKLTVDPDGANNGLEDLDGDGFYDDFIPGELKVEAVYTVDCSKFDMCNTHSFYFNWITSATYTTMCEGTSRVSTGNLTASASRDARNNNNISYSGLGSTATMPANVEPGRPFDVRLSLSATYFGSPYRTTNSRLVYEITLPSGVSYVANSVVWKNGIYGTGTNNVVSGAVVTQNGNVLRIQAPNGETGFVDKLSFTYTCGASGRIPFTWRLYDINDITANCVCPQQILCSEISTSVYCPGSCPGGAEIGDVKTERADVSLGWTDGNMTTRQSRANISAYDLSKALYLDFIDVTAEGAQNGAYDNLHLRMQLPKTTSAPIENKLTPISIDVTVTRGGVDYSANITSFSMANSTANKQIIDWDLTSLRNQLPGGTFQNGDTYKTVAHYQVRTNNLPQNDVQSGELIYYYNKDTSGNIIKCNEKIPGMYLVGTHSVNGTNSMNAEGCKAYDLTGGYHIGRRFNTTGIPYQTEFRPSLRVNSFVLEVPKGYDLESVTIRPTSDDRIVYGSGVLPKTINVALTTPTITATGAKLYTFTNDGSWPPMALTKQNTYGGLITPVVRANCSTLPQETIKSSVVIQDFYYNTTQSITQTIAALDRAITHTRKPEIGFTNQTGEIQAHRAEESFVVRYTSTGMSEASMRWIAIDNVDGVEILKVEKITGGTSVLTPVPYANGKMYHLSGSLATGRSEDYRVTFTYKDVCAPTEIPLYAGWNCTGNYPASPTDYSCHAQTLNVRFVPQPTQVELIPVTQPITAINLCQDIDYQFDINNKLAGSVRSVTFTVKLPTGMNFVSGSFMAEYPKGSGNWQAIASTQTGNQYVFNLSSHSGLPADKVIPGVLADGGNANRRLISVRFKVQADCNFTSGSVIELVPEAYRICGERAESSGLSLDTTSNNVNLGAGAISYSFNNYVITPTDSNALSICSSTQELQIEGSSTMIGSGTTNDTSYINFVIPQGFEYVPSSFAHLSGPVTTFVSDNTTDASGSQVVVLKMPSGVSIGQQMRYTIKIRKKPASIGCNTEVALRLITLNEVYPMLCGTTPCSDPFKVQTGARVQKYVINYPELAFTKLTTSVSGNSFNGTLAIQNNGIAQAESTTVKFFCVDALGNRTGSALHSVSVPALASGATSADVAFSFTSTCGVDNIKAFILKEDNCVCTEESEKLDLLPIAADDTACFTPRTLVSIKILDNDTEGDTVVPSRVSLVSPSGATNLTYDSQGDLVAFTVTARGTWSVDNLGELTLTPAGATMPSPINYVVYDAEGNKSNEATVTLVQVPGAPAASAQTFCNNTSSTVAKLVPNGSNYAWYDVATGGTPLIQTHPLVSGTYYVANVSGNCESARTPVTVTLVACSVIDAVDDNYTSSAGGSTTTPVTSNDTLNGTPVVIGTNPGEVTLTPGTTPTGITLNPNTGQVTIASTVPSGIYTFTYEICENGANPANCDTATVTVTVSNPIDAVDNNFTPINGANGGTTASVLNNDTLNGNPVNSSNVTLTWSTSVPSGLTPNADGTITVAAGTVSGTYQIPYTICEAGVVGVTNCDTATATVVVTAPVIVATDDTFTPISGANGGTAGNVLSNNGNGADTLNGVPAMTSSVTIAEVTPATPINGGNVPTLNPSTGDVTVPPSTPAGTYTIVYRICEKLNPTNCDTATVTVVVTAPVIVATDDTFTPINGANGGTAGNVLSNNGNGADTLNGVPATTSSVTIAEVTPATPINGGNVPTLNPSTGDVTVPPSTPAGTYTIVYRICERLNPTNCDTATVTVVVTAPVILANNDNFAPINGSNGGTTSSVLTNDELNGSTPSTSSVTLTWGTVPSGSGLVTNTDGTITVPSGTASGTYEIPYTICEILNPSNCSTATATVVVTAPVILANNDNFAPINGANGGTTSSVLTNDELNGSTPSTSSVTLTWGTVPSGSGLVTNTDGTITVPSGTASGTYEIPYTICEVLNPSNCSTATATVVVTAPVILANPDTPTPINGNSGGNAGNVLTNDDLNGTPPSTSSVTISVTTPATPINGGNVPTLDPSTGDVTVPPSTPAGTYTIVYRICEKLNPNNCSTASVTIVVTAQGIDAQNDDFGSVPGNATTVAGNVLTNDTLGSGAATTTTVVISEIAGATPIGGSTNVPTLNTATGEVTVPQGTPAGTYNITYRICEQLNPDNCDTATVTVQVTAFGIVANDDDYTAYPVYTTTGGTPTVTTIVANDTLSGTTATLATVSISNVVSSHSNISVDLTNGTVVILPNTPAGVYTLTYEICEIANTSNCSNRATITVAVLNVPKANDDFSTTEINTPVTIDILTNDENVPTAGSVTVISNPANGSVQINDGGTPSDPSDDTVTYTPNPGFIGADSFVYELCDAAGNCATATVTVDVVGGGDIVPHNGISVNDDGSNDVFYIKGIESYPNNTVRIYNRWGVKVFETQGYNNTTRAFRGISNGRVTIEAPEKLPQGTYYYVIEYVDKNNQTQRKASWLYIKH